MSVRKPMSALETDARRDALYWRKAYEELWDAVDAYRLREPGRRGYPAARRELDRVWRREEES